MTILFEIHFVFNAHSIRFALTKSAFRVDRQSIACHLFMVNVGAFILYECRHMYVCSLKLSFVVKMGRK